MIDWKELFPAEAIAPFIGGLVLWFGFNYVFFAPQVISPRLAERYYYPACETAVAEYGNNFATEWQKRLEEQEREVQARGERTRQKLAEHLASLGNSPQVGAVFGMLGINTAVDAEILHAMNEIRGEYAQKNEADLREIMKNRIHKTSASYCNCVIGTVLDNRFDMASYTSSLRLYTPASIGRLQSGQAIFDTPACGTAPVA